VNFVDQFRENTVEVGLLLKEDVPHVFLLLLKFGQRAFDQFFVIFEFLFFLVRQHDDFFFVLKDLLSFDQLVLHFEHFAVQVEVLETREVVIFEVLLKLFLEGFVFIFHL
jgi:hypothetical protein